MSGEKYRYWPFNVLPPEERSAFDAELISILELAHANGFAAYVDATESTLGFGDPQCRAVEFLRRGRYRFWEPLITDGQNCIRLGPVFSLSEYACVVFDGIEDVSTFAMRWLNGDPLGTALQGLLIYDRHDTNTPPQVYS